MSAPASRDVVLVRHCQATGQQPDAPLTDEGARQAQRLAEFLAGYPVDFVATSRYRRARRTIEPYAENSGLPIHQDHRLNERVLSTEPLANWEEFVRRSFDDPDLCGPGGESAAHVLRRAQAALDEILDRGHRLPLLVTHGNLMALLLHSLDATFGFQGWQSLTNPDVYLVIRRTDGGGKFERVWPP